MVLKLFTNFIIIRRSIYAVFATRFKQVLFCLLTLAAGPFLRIRLFSLVFLQVNRRVQS